MAEAVVRIIVSLLMLWAGANVLVTGASRIARTLGLTPTVVGLTIVAYGTSMPEWMVSTTAAINDRGDLAVGNVLGSNICNIGIVLGLAAVCRPLKFSRGTTFNHVPFMIGAAVVVTLFLLDGRVSRWEGALLAVTCVGYTVFCVRGASLPKSETDQESAGSDSSTPLKRLMKPIALVLIGLALLLVGGRVLVQGAVSAARILDVSEAVIALTVVAVGTSAPDCAAAIVAALRGAGGLAVGTAIGSVVFNLLFVLGTASLVRPLLVNDITPMDHVVHLAFLVLSFIHLKSGMTMSRSEGVFCVAAYVAYVVIRWPAG